MIALTLSLLLTDIRLEGTWDCPDRESVRQELRELRAPVDNLTAELVRSGDSFELLLIGSSGDVLARRILPGDPHCERLAKVIAVLLSTWVNELSARPPELPGPASAVGLGTAGTSPGRPTPSTPPASGTAVASSGAPSTAAPPAPAAEPPAAVVAAAGVPAVAPTAPSSETTRVAAPEWRMGVGALGLVTGDGVAAGALLFGAFAPRSSSWGVHLKGWWATPSSFALGPGEVKWQRFSASTGASYTLPLEAFSIELQGDLALSLLQTQASSFVINRSPQAVDPGLSFGVLAIWHLRPLEPWLGIWGILWPFPESAQVEGVSTVRDIPQFQFLVSVGAALPIP